MISLNYGSRTPGPPGCVMHHIVIYVLRYTSYLYILLVAREPPSNNCCGTCPCLPPPRPAPLYLPACPRFVITLAGASVLDTSKLSLKQLVSKFCFCWRPDKQSQSYQPTSCVVFSFLFILLSHVESCISVRFSSHESMQFISVYC